ncbi:hypothetical protein Syun_025315 [Stephania yunnanensis]|uniref:Uncharacterized protein n=1 Tax=Stephania yunnanensis TaxID=152371 RepID=A0AAP0EU26_9MAGN
MTPKVDVTSRFKFGVSILCENVMGVGNPHGDGNPCWMGNVGKKISNKEFQVGISYPVISRDGMGIAFPDIREENQPLMQLLRMLKHWRGFHRKILKLGQGYAVGLARCATKDLRQDDILLRQYPSHLSWSKYIYSDFDHGSSARSVGFCELACSFNHNLRIPKLTTEMDVEPNAIVTMK